MGGSFCKGAAAMLPEKDKTASHAAKNNLIRIFFLQLVIFKTGLNNKRVK
jgi:hypothetical protein